MTYLLIKVSAIYLQIKKNRATPVYYFHRLTVLNDEVGKINHELTAYHP